MAQDGDLKKFEKKMEPSGKPASTTSPTDIDNKSCEEKWQRDNPGRPLPEDVCPDSLLNSDTAGTVVLILLSPFYVPALAIGDHYDESLFLSAYPFFKERGYFSGSGKTWLIRAGAAREWTVQDPQAWRGDLSLLTSSRLGLDIAYTRYQENMGDESDSLAFFQFMPTFSFARTEKWDWRFGLGYEAAEGREHHDRLRLAYLIRHFFRVPFHLDLDFGVSVASGKPIFEIAPGIAYHWNRLELKATYRRINISDVSLHGPEVAIAFWF